MRSTTRRDRFRRIIAADQPPCHICGEAIDYTAHYLHPLSFTIDHIVPINRSGGVDVDVLDNCAAAHRKCNRDKSDKIRAGVGFVTDRTW